MLSSKCAIFSYNKLYRVKHGDIIIDCNNVPSVVFIQPNFQPCTLNLKRKPYQTQEYINIPTEITKFIEDPINFYSFLIDPMMCPFSCYISEIYLCKKIHRNIIKKYFQLDNRYRYTIAYPHIYQINKLDNYDIQRRKI